MIILTLLAGLPPIAPEPPPGSDMILKLVGNAKWMAGIALLAGFFIGLAVWAGGRWVDHHRAGRVGTVMMLSAIFGGLLYGIGVTIINTFTNGG